MGGFGFTPDDSSEDPKDPFNFQDIFKQFSGLGLNLPGLMASLSGQASPAALSKELIRDISRKFLSAHGDVPVTVAGQNATKEALQIADLWLNEATVFPNLPIPEGCALSRRDWIDATLLGWQEIAKPLVAGMSEAMSRIFEENAGDTEQFTIPGAPFNISKSTITSIIGTFMSSMLSTQLGQTIGALSTTVTGASDNEAVKSHASGWLLKFSLALSILGWESALLKESWNLRKFPTERFTWFSYLAFNLVTQ